MNLCFFAVPAFIHTDGQFMFEKCPRSKTRTSVSRAHITIRSGWHSTVTENDINVLSAAAAMFWARIIHFHRYRHCTTSVNTIIYKPEVLITPKRKQVSTRSQGLLQCFGDFKLGCARIDGIRLQRTASRTNFRFGVLFLLPVFTWSFSPKSDIVGMPYKTAATAEITFISFSVAK